MGVVELEREINQLRYEDRLLLIERLVRGLRQETSPDREVRQRQMALMAADPEIQREIHAINAEFEAAEMDGLE